ncbi:hypothetical protein NQ317_013235 [Molorchus minor]|uniref:RRP15-like protein n=1 Tax=Molorchus minor TaxID=1323400 RepID=A0ABQ9JSY2_9CUCU|nr:hypothetical protein NQ317_013235 [Molorchus minor]
MRSRTKTKKSKNRNHLGGTGGGSFHEDPLTKYEEEILDIIKNNNDVTITKNVETENFTISGNEPKKLINTSKKVPKRQTKFLKNSGAAVEMFEKTYKQKLSNKENYMVKKLELLERIAVSKEKTAIAKEKIAASNERNANATEKMCDVLKDISEAIKEFI